MYNVYNQRIDADATVSASGSDTGACMRLIRSVSLGVEAVPSLTAHLHTVRPEECDSTLCSMLRMQGFDRHDVLPDRCSPTRTDRWHPECKLHCLAIQARRLVQCRPSQCSVRMRLRPALKQLQTLIVARARAQAQRTAYLGACWASAAAWIP